MSWWEKWFWRLIILLPFVGFFIGFGEQAIFIPKDTILHGFWAVWGAYWALPWDRKKVLTASIIVEVIIEAVLYIAADPIRQRLYDRISRWLKPNKGYMTERFAIEQPIIDV